MKSVQEKIQEREEKVHTILTGILLNGYSQGQTLPELNSRVLDFGKREIRKLFASQKEGFKTILKDERKFWIEILEKEKITPPKPQMLRSHEML